MDLSPRTVSLLNTLEEHSGTPLLCKSDLGVLVELATRHDRATILDELGFLAKFITRTYRIMQRIGKNGNGYDRLSTEFTNAVTSSTALLTALVEEAPETVRTHLMSSYLTLSQDSFRHFIDLCSDLGRYKNWLIDSEHPGELPD
jgi:hypothetical protein